MCTFSKPLFRGLDVVDRRTPRGRLHGSEGSICLACRLGRGPGLHPFLSGWGEESAAHAAASLQGASRCTLVAGRLRNSNFSKSLCAKCCQLYPIVLKPIFSSEYSFCSIFQNLPVQYLCNFNFTPLQSQNISKIRRYKWQVW